MEQSSTTIIVLKFDVNQAAWFIQMLERGDIENYLNAWYTYK